MPSMMPCEVMGVMCVLATLPSKGLCSSMTKSFQSMTGRNCGCPLMTTVVEPPELLLLVLPTVTVEGREGPS